MRSLAGNPIEALPAHQATRVLRVLRTNTPKFKLYTTSTLGDLPLPAYPSLSVEHAVFWARQTTGRLKCGGRPTKARQNLTHLGLVKRGWRYDRCPGLDVCRTKYRWPTATGHGRAPMSKKKCGH